MVGTSSLHLWLIPLIPFAGFVLIGLLGRRLTQPVTSVVALVSTAAPLALAAHIASLWKSLTLPHVESFSFHLPGIGASSWIATFTLRSTLTFLLDPLSLMMLLLVSGVCLLVQLYSLGLMRKQPGYERFTAYLNLLLFSMLLLVLANNFLIMFTGWEGIGLASYLLTGFRFESDSAARSAGKAFIVDRIGDFAFLLAMLLMIAHFGALSFTNVFPSITRHTIFEHGGFITAICLLLLVAAVNKSAQFPLHIWLLETNEQPAPAAALIQTVTSPAAGIYLLARAHVLFNHSQFTLEVMIVIGMVTALIAAVIALVESDLYRGLAYSTISQFGIMFVAAGATAFSAALFHLVTHAFFKAALLLAAGSVIHALSGERDMRFMGGMRKVMPATFWLTTMAVLAIAGIPPLSGFFSDSAAVYAGFASSTLSPASGVVLLITIFVTSFYIFRIWYLVFLGKRSGAIGAFSSRTGGFRPHESSWVMLIPLALLALLSVGSGWISVPRALGGGERMNHFIASSLTTPRRSFEELSIQMNVEGAPAAAAASAMQPPAEPKGDPFEERILSAVSIALSLLGWFFADLFYRRRPGTAARFAHRMRAAHSVPASEYWVNSIYSAMVIGPVMAVSRRLLAIESRGNGEERR